MTQETQTTSLSENSKEVEWASEDDGGDTIGTAVVDVRPSHRKNLVASLAEKKTHKRPKQSLWKVQKERALKAIEWAQKKMKTSFVFSLDRLPNPPAGTDHPVFTITRSSRNEDDRNLFFLGAHPRTLANETMRTLRVLAVHEIIHAIVWPITEDEDPNAEENAVYMLQRAIVGDAY